MISSMTGFGSGRVQVKDEEISVELKSVNHKFCEVKARMPRELAALEQTVAKTVRDRLARGAIDATVKRSPVAGVSSAPKVDAALAREYRRAMSEVAQAAGLADTLSAAEIASLPGVMRMEEREVDLEAAEKAVGQALQVALDGLVGMRQREGGALDADLRGRLSTVERLANELSTLSPQSVETYKARLEERIGELSRGLPLDPQRLAQEVAHFADRVDITEELTRLSAHVAQFRTLLDQKEPSGRKLDFLVQEMHREANTTGSKSQSAEISQRVVSLKAELERIREQVQNVE